MKRTLTTDLPFEELEELAERLWRGWGRAMNAHYDESIAAAETGATEAEIEGQVRVPRDLVDELEATYMPVVNDFWGRQLGCRWTACRVCQHESCGFCPTCNPGSIAPDGIAYDDADEVAS